MIVLRKNINRARRFSRVLLKISGESFCGPWSSGIDRQEAAYIANEIIAARKTGAEIAVVVGGGNLVRGSAFSGGGVGVATADYMGMLATIINSLLLQDVLENLGVSTRVMSALAVHAVAEPFIRRRCIRHLEKGRLVILAGGTGNPHFTTDTAAALRAAEIKAEVVLKATKVEGVFSSDPVRNKNARLYDRLTYREVLINNLHVMDATAITMCRENSLPIIVFNLKKPGNIARAVCGKSVGTRIDT
jgi:uridylate kinase